MSMPSNITSSNDAVVNNPNPPTSGINTSDRRPRHPARRFMQPSPRSNQFEGRCEDLKGHIYDSADARQADQYTKTTREIAEFIGRT